MATLLFDSKSAKWIQSPGHSRNFSNAVVDFDPAAIGETRMPRPLIDNAPRTFPFKVHVDVLELFEKLQQNLDSRLDPSRSDAQGRRPLHNVRRKRLVIHVYTHADDHILQQ